MTVDGSMWRTSYVVGCGLIGAVACLKRLCFGIIYEGAGVDNDGICAFMLVSDVETGSVQISQQDFSLCKQIGVYF